MIAKKVCFWVDLKLHP